MIIICTRKHDFDRKIVGKLSSFVQYTHDVLHDEHHPVLLQRFASLVLLYKTLDLLTYLLRVNVLLGPFWCYAHLACCLFTQKYYKNV